MSLASRITRVPRAFDTTIGDEAAASLGALAPEVRALVRGAAGCAPYLAGLIAKEGAWLEGAAANPEEAVAAIIREVGVASGDLGVALRQAKRRVALITALADLGGVWSLEDVTGALTDFADAACQAALHQGLLMQVRRGKVPGMTEEDLGDACGMVVMAMGKMGAHELNYSSDIDLICLFDESRFAAEDFHDARSAFVRATRAMTATLSELTAEGYVFRTDLRLRPDSGVTPVCMAMEAAERYYESLGRTWERAAYIKARPAAGDLVGGARFLETLRPFVWRKHLDFAAIQDAHDMRLAIRSHKGLHGPITLPGHNMKLGRGGIREIEFFTQTRQLIAGGRDMDLRTRGTCAGLAVLAQKGWVPEEVAQTLTDHYTSHRLVEHRLQMLRDAQTHDLPTSDEGFARLAAFMDMDVPALQADLRARLSDVHRLTEGFFTSGGRGVEPPPPEEHQFDTSVLDRWLSYPALRSQRGAALFEELKPELLTRLSHAAKPDEALLAFDGFLSGLPAGVQLFSLLKANPQLADLLIDSVSTSPALAAHLSRNASVFDAVIGGDFFSTWPGEADLAQMLSAHLAAAGDYETRLDETRRWAREWHFRIGVHLLRGLIDPEEAGGQYADLARAVLSALWPIVVDQFATRHGPPPGRGAVLLGMGSLGAGRLTATSDLDMLVIYDPAEVEMSEGPRPLATRLYYARLTQAMITAMTAPMSQGKLYEIDMRLRPSGNQGPVATALRSFETYQTEDAWTWEHLALARARVVAGPPALASDVSALCARILAMPRQRAAVLADVADMRTRIGAAKQPEGILDAKIGPGRLQDIELLAQAGALIAGQGAHSIPQGLSAAQAAALLSAQAAEHLTVAYQTCWALQCAGRLLSAQAPQVETLGQAGMTFLAQALGRDTFQTLESQLDDLYAQAAAIIDRALADEGSQHGQG